MRSAAEHPTGPPAPQPAASGDLRAVLGKAHAEAMTLLEGSGGKRLEAVAWLSAHIAAFEHAVYPVAKRRLPDSHTLLDDDRDVASHLTRTLRIAERHHAGDVLASNLSAQRVSERLRELLAENRAMQERIVAGLEQVLDGPAVIALTASYANALAHAPTRPHPHLRSGIMFRLEAFRDRILDTMDGRHVPVPRMPRRQIIPGRWGAYLIGQQHQAPAEADEEPAGP